MSARIYDFFASTQLSTPCLVVDLDVVAENFEAFCRNIPFANIYYAMKANPDPAIMKLLAGLGSNFDCASTTEIDLALQTGIDAKRISFGNTIKKKSDIQLAYSLGVRLFATDSMEDVQKIAEAAPGADVFCRILTSGEGADWPLSRKFGCEKELAADILVAARELGLNARGVSFHVGSQMTDAKGWKQALIEARWVFDMCELNGFKLNLLNMGGGFPTRYLKDIPSCKTIGETLKDDLDAVFSEGWPEYIIIEPGRGMVGNAGIIKSEVVLAARKSDHDDVRWVYLDIGKFGGLAETTDEAIRYQIVTDNDERRKVKTVLAGPTCDSIDVLYEKVPYDLPEVQSGEFVYIEGTGAYTTTYSSISFNGFAPLKSIAI